MNLTLNYPQHVFLNELNTKYSAFVGGYGSGKTFVGCNKLSIFASKYPKTPQGYFAPTYRDIRDTFWPTFDEVAFNFGYNTKINKSDKEVHLFRGKLYYGTIICRSMDQPGSIVGFKIANGLVDEIDVFPKEKALLAWRKIIARLRYVIDGVVNSLGVTTTPEGFRFTYDTFALNPTESYSMVQSSTYENEKNLPNDYIPSLYETYTPELVDAYINGEFTNLNSGTVYKYYNRKKHRSKEIVREREPIFIGQDFNVGNMWSAIFIQRGKVWHCVGQLKGVYDTPELIRILQEKYPKNEITVYPDASGKSRKTVNASISDISLLEQSRFRVKANKINPFVKDRINSVNKAFQDGKVLVNDRLAPDIAECLEKQAYDDNGEPDKKSGFDHGNDAFGYPIAFEMPVNKKVFYSKIGFGR